MMYVIVLSVLFLVGAALAGLVRFLHEKIVENQSGEQDIGEPNIGTADIPSRRRREREPTREDFLEEMRTNE